MMRGKPVDARTPQIILSAFPARIDRPNLRARRFVRRFACFASGGMRQSLPRFSCFAVTHRYEEHIAGRTYEIEVRAVSQSRWRAEIARRPGMPTSLMPFYGRTPDEAAQELRRWLALVYNGTTKQ
jgi:hypothetical protein